MSTLIAKTGLSILENASQSLLNGVVGGVPRAAQACLVTIDNHITPLIGSASSSVIPSGLTSLPQSPSTSALPGSKLPEVSSDAAALLPEQFKELGNTLLNKLTEGFTALLKSIGDLVGELKNLIERLPSGLPAAETSTTSAADSTAIDPNADSETESTNITTSGNVSNDNSSARVSTLARTGQFLWKPASEKDGKLVVLLPNKFNGKVKNVKVLSADGSRVLATGAYSGIGNGDRQHYRFKKAGADLPKNSIVQIALNDGSSRQLHIAKPGQRYIR